MDSVPKLLPIWHDIAFQDFVRQKGRAKFTALYPPDHGGIGIDVNASSVFECRNLKFAGKQMSFAASSCALPFLPLRKIDKVEDLCLEPLKREKFEFDKFCMKLTFVRNSTKKKASLSKLKAHQHKLNACKNQKGDRGICIEVPKSIVDLAENFPKRVIIPEFNVSYAGGALVVCKSLSKQNLLHPVTGDLNKLCITPMEDDCENHFKPDLSRQLSVNLGSDPILQIEPALNDFCCVRQKNSFHVVNMNNLNVYTKTLHKSSLYHVAVRPYNPMEILSVYDKGMLKLTNLETRKTLWSMSNHVYYNSDIIYPSWRCGFGSHPFSALCMNEKKLYCFDSREKEYTIKEIFNIENPSCYIGEELVAMKQWNKNSFQYLLTSNHHLIMCDERYSKEPVMYWNHTLKAPPIYLECADLNNNMSCIVIGTQRTREVAAFLCSHETDIQPVSLTPSLLMSAPNDCIESLKFHCYYVDGKFSSRLSYPLSGISIVSKSKEIAGFTVFQSTSVGDIFYQDFKLSPEAIEKTYHVSTGCILTPPEKILPHLKKWMLRSDSDEASAVTDEVITRITINIEKILRPPKEISSNCTVCRLSSTSDEKELIVSETCPTCNLTSTESQHFSKAMANVSAVIGPTSAESGFLDCDMDNLSQFHDTYSKRILSVWLNSDDLGDMENIDDQDLASGDA